MKISKATNQLKVRVIKTIDRGINHIETIVDVTRQLNFKGTKHLSKLADMLDRVCRAVEKAKCNADVQRVITRTWKSTTAEQEGALDAMRAFGMPDKMFEDIEAVISLGVIDFDNREQSGLLVQWADAYERDAQPKPKAVEQPEETKSEIDPRVAAEGLTPQMYGDGELEETNAFGH